jgi:hypothetical protein
MCAIDSALRRTSRARSLDHRNIELESEIEQGREEAEQLTRSFKRHLLSMRTLLTVSQDLNRAQELEELVKDRVAHAGGRAARLEPGHFRRAP